MNRNTISRRSWQLVVACLLSIAASAAAAQTADGGMRIEVTSAETRRPLADVTVTVADRDGREIQGVTTADGVVEFDALEAGLYSVTAEAPGVVTAIEPSVRVVRRKISPLALALLPQEEAIEEIVVLARGRVADPYGPASNSFLNREELRSAVGAGTDVMRALDGLPGLISTGDFANFSVRGRGPRDNLIFVDGLPVEIEAEALMARALQHELDHLDGILFLDRLVSRRQDLFQRKVYQRGGGPRSG